MHDNYNKEVISILEHMFYASIFKFCAFLKSIFVNIGLFIRLCTGLSGGARNVQVGPGAKPK